ncbi:MAG: hypothetical protein KGL63_02825 [Betaproteobacteria bacterium]|nr:hypothetical protein [Betaproteobacteria bacterium]
MTPTPEHDHSEPSDNPLDPGILLPRMVLGLLSVLVLAGLFEVGVQIVFRLSEGVWRLDLLEGFAKGLARIIADGILLSIGWVVLAACGLLLARIGMLTVTLARRAQDILPAKNKPPKRARAPIEKYLVKDYITVIPDVWTGLPSQGDPERLKQGIKLSKGQILGPPMDLGVATPGLRRRRASSRVVPPHVSS